MEGARLPPPHVFPPAPPPPPPPPPRPPPRVPPPPSSQHVPHDVLRCRDGPALPVRVHAFDRLRQREAHRALARFPVELHRSDEGVHRRRRRQVERQVVALQQPLHAIRSARLRDPESFCETRLVRHADRHCFAVRRGELRGRLARLC